MLSYLNNLLIGPLKLVFDVIFSIAEKYNGGHIIRSVIVLSLTLNLLLLPLYNRAEEIQIEENEKKKALQPWIKHIRRTFHGDERFMILQTFYRQNHYSPMQELRGGITLALEIPFFLAAYQFLSGLQLLNGAEFKIIKDLGMPDGLLTIGSTAINVFPILMTVINLISSMIYTKDTDIKSKVQLYAMAVIFLVLLYPSPAGLTIYWTMNNMLSLVKNLYYKKWGPKGYFSVFASFTGVCLFILSSVKKGTTARDIGLGLFLLFVMQIPLCLKILKRRNTSRKIGRRKDNDYLKRRPNAGLFFMGAVFLAVLTGILIPVNVIKGSPAEFIENDTLVNPLYYVWHSSLLAFGTFVVWVGIFYLLAEDKIKKILEICVWAAALAAVANYMFLGGKNGTMSSLLQYDQELFSSTGRKVFNLVIVFVVLAAVLCVMISDKKDKIIFMAGRIGITAIIVMSLTGIFSVQKSASEVIRLKRLENQKELTIPLSQTGKNVVVLMLDRAVGAFVPSILYEKPELAEKYDGFVYYPNTVSHGGHTNFGAPGLFGGYEYTPYEMNKRSNELLKDKYNEAISVLPVMFSREGYRVTACQIPYAGTYDEQADYSIYDGIPNMQACDIEETIPINLSTDRIQELRERNFFCYSLFISAPTICQTFLYDGGNYNRTDVLTSRETDLELPADETIYQEILSISSARGTTHYFARAYTVLSLMNSMTNITDEETGTFLMMVNNTAHSPLMLSEPDYMPKMYVDNTYYDEMHTDRFLNVEHKLNMEQWFQMTHYHVNVAALEQVSKWLDFLKEKGVYDNTRIIIAADHGYNLEMMEDMIMEDGTDLMMYNPLLMVKDFNSRGELVTDGAFMTNADVPAIAVKDVIEDPVNPFTGKRLDTDEKTGNVQYVIASHEFEIKDNNGTTYKKGIWYSVHDNIFDKTNWVRLGEF